MSFVSKLVCAKCDTKYRPRENQIMCARRDFGRLDIEYDYRRVARSVGRADFGKGQNGIWRFSDLLPVKERFAISLGEGGTRLLKARRLAERIGLSKTYLKDETRNPTGSFKDRAMAVGVSKAVELGVKTVVTASSGNAAASLAAYSAKAGLSCYAFVLESVSAGKIAQLTLHGATVVKIRGIEKGEDPTVHAMLRAVETQGWYPCPSFGPFNPYQVEGPKTIAYEIVQQMNWKVPDWVIVPTGSACLLTGLWKGVRDLLELNWIQEPPKLAPVQPQGNSPLIKALKKNLPFEELKPERSPKTIAQGLSDPYPWDGDAALEAVRKSKGEGVSVGDGDIVTAVRELARSEGIFAEPSGAVGVAGLTKLLSEGLVDRNESAVILVTGSGLKDVSTTLPKERAE